MDDPKKSEFFAKKNLKDITIRHFRGFENYQITNLKDVNIFAGKHFAGKTSVLHAIECLFMNNVDPLRQVYRYIEDYGIAATNKMCDNGDFNDIDKLLRCKIQTHYDKSSELKTPFQRLINTGLSLYDKYNIRPKLIDFLSGVSVDYWINHVKTYYRLYDEELAICNFQAEDRCEERDIIDEMFTNDYNGYNKKCTKFNEESYLHEIQFCKPHLNMLVLALMFKLSSNGFLLIDNIEGIGCHYLLLADVWEFIYQQAKKYNVQLFITTHNLEYLDNIPLAYVHQHGPDNYFNSFYKLDSTLKLPVYLDSEQLELAINYKTEVR